MPDIIDSFNALNLGDATLYGIGDMAPGFAVPDPIPDEVAGGDLVVEAHFQGMVRTSFPAQTEDEVFRHDRYLILSKNAKSTDSAGLYVSQVGDLDSLLDNFGEPFDPPPAGSEGVFANTERYWNLADEVGLRHPGGMQAVGSTLVVPWSQGGPGQVRFYDITNPRSERPGMPGSSTSTLPETAPPLFLNGSQGEPEQSAETSSGPTAAAMTCLADGRHLMFVAAGNNSESGWFYLSDAPGLDGSTSWDFLQFWSHETSATLDTSEDRGDEWGYWQTLQFFTECGTGDIYLAALGHRCGGDSLDCLPSRTRLYKLVNAGPSDRLDLELVARQDSIDVSRPRGTLFRNSWRFAATLHVAADGKFIAYGSNRNQRQVPIAGLTQWVLWFDQFETP